jgi:hypothetical protein
MKKIVLLVLGLSLSLCWASSKTKHKHKHKHKHVQQSNHKENRVPAPIMDEELNPAKRPAQW